MLSSHNRPQKCGNHQDIAYGLSSMSIPKAGTKPAPTATGMGYRKEMTKEYKATYLKKYGHPVSFEKTFDRPPRPEEE